MTFWIRTALVLVALCGGPSPTRAAPAPGPRRSKQAKTPRFQQQWLTPYLTTGVAGQAREALLAGRPREAARLLRRYLKRGGAHGKRRPLAHAQQARFLLAHALLRDHTYGEAAAMFGKLERSYGLLADYSRFYAAKCHHALKDFNTAAKAARRVRRSSPLYQDARLVLADALRALGQHEQVAAIWREFLDQHPGGRRLAQAHFRLAQALERQSRVAPAKKRPELLKQALTHYKVLLARAPLHRLHAAAEKRVRALARRVPGGAELARLSQWERYSRAMAFYRAVRHRLAEPAFKSLLADKTLSPKLRCRASYYLAKTVFRKRERARAAPLFRAAATACRKAGKGETNLVVKSMYNRAKGLTRAHKFDEAIALFGKLEREFPRHSYADDARLWAAEAAEGKGDAKQASRLLDTLPRTYPRGDMAREALWRLARSAIVAGKRRRALQLLDRILDTMGRAERYYALGQALYWKARLLDQAGKRKAAREQYEACIRDYPLSYYALMAFNRLRERHGATYRRLVRELLRPVGRGAGSWHFKPRGLFGKPGFLRGVELARLGFGAQAAAEMARVGLRIGRGEPTEDLWLAAVIFDRAGLWDRSHQVPRSLDHGYRSSYPLKEAYRRWTIAYPRAYTPLVRAGARRADIAAELVWAVMREESGFSASIESWANAVGLMQLLVPTAKRAGSAERVEVTRRRLHDPAVNIKLGANYLGFLSRMFGGVPALAIAGYNAGEGSVSRWLRKRGNVPLDQFLDQIPYDQTRRYTKRVLSSLFTYAVLYRPAGKRVPRLPQKLPAVRRASMKREPSRASKHKAGKGAGRKGKASKRKAKGKGKAAGRKAKAAGRRAK